MLAASAAVSFSKVNALLCRCYLWHLNAHPVFIPRRCGQRLLNNTENHVWTYAGL